MKWLVLWCFMILCACDDSQAIHEPHPSLERMQTQERVNPFDERGMETPPLDTVARDHDPTTTTAADGGDLPITVDMDLLSEGRESFDRVCATCHGMLGDGDSVVASKMKDRPPPSLLDARIASLSAQTNFDVITQGYGLMPSFAHMLDARERWSVVAYLEALRLSRHANVADLPSNVRQELNDEAAK
jgi:mono/diheme cytochrome c family protein